MQASKMRTKGRGNRHHTTHPVPGTARAEAIDIRAGVFRQPAMQTPVLVLNASYEPINICGARRALVLVLKGIARTEEEQGSTLALAPHGLPDALGHPPAGVPPHPAPDPRPEPQKHPAARPQHLPVLPGSVLTAAELTLDHVVPRSRGGLSTWENLVACCRECNRRKGNQMLHELSDMKLLREPRPFSLHTSRHIMRMIGSADAAWRKYLYFESESAA